MKINKKTTTIVTLSIILLFSFILFGLTGVRTILGILILLFLPFYLILNNFNLDELEKIFFSFFIGIALFPLFVWYLNKIVPSLRVTIILTFIILISISLFLRRKFRKI